MMFKQVLLTLILSVAGAAQTPNLSGTWQMDTSKSHLADGRTLSLTFVQKGDAIKLDGFTVDKTGAKTPLRFDCKADGSECEFMEGDHKSKVSMWTIAGVITICKTDGPTGDAVTEWHAKIDGGTLSMDVEHVDPVGPAETMVFTKKAAE